ncbi:response regulator transcription factor [Fulvivirgaceae bacterium BMA12]|uniref:Response regulator transcription factor n=1 Tax=Agaribacillus aureus TaxID=3051825 RepID=A0ABT8L3E3_9BACT|nr:response regulator transcription factor [Fulvivirgaceae bacterium BMA12]
MSEIKVLLADRHDLTSAGIRAFIAEKHDLTLINSATSKGAVLKSLAESKPDVLIVDHNIQGFLTLNDLAEAKEISSQTKLLIISSDDDRENINRVLESGINGYVTKECSKQEIVNAIYATAKGQKFFCNKILDILLEKHNQKEDENCEPTNLSKRETEILKLIAKGNSTLKIADKLHLSHHTVNTHRKNILKKLKVKSPTELIIYAINTGLIKPQNTGK